MKRKIRPTELPRFDSLGSCAAATGIPLAVIKRAKRDGCTAFKNSRVDLAPLLKFIFASAPGELDLPELQARQIQLQNDKLTAQNSILRREWIPSDEVREWGVALGSAIKTIVSGLHLAAPSLAGISVVEISNALKRQESEILSQLSTLGDQISEHESAARGDTFSEVRP